MNNIADDKSCFPKKETVEVKDRRRFLKQMATCAIAAPLITVLPQMAAARTSGAPIDPPDPKMGATGSSGTSTDNTPGSRSRNHSSSPWWLPWFLQ